MKEGVGEFGGAGPAGPGPAAVVSMVFHLRSSLWWSSDIVASTVPNNIASVQWGRQFW